MITGELKAVHRLIYVDGIEQTIEMVNENVAA